MPAATEMLQANKSTEKEIWADLLFQKRAFFI